MTAQTIDRTTPRASGDRRRPPRWGSVASQAFLICACVLWLLPIAFALYVALRPYSETQKYGYVSLPHHLTLKNFSDAWTQSDMLHYFWNSVLITVPSVIIVLALASGLAFVLTRVNVKINVTLLIVFTAETCCRSRSSSPRCTASSCRSTCRPSWPAAGCCTTRSPV